MRMVVEESVRSAGNDPIFAVAAKADKRIEEVGRENVINSTLGALMDDEGALVTFDSVYDLFKNLPDDQIAAYAGIAGIAPFLDKVQEACFRDKRPDAHIRAVATPGGTGAVRNAVSNYTELGDKILIPDWHWAPYKTIAEENRRSWEIFPMFNEEGNFNIKAYEEAMLKLLEKQGRVLSILNTPAHNPTGYSISIPEWKELIEFYTKTAEEHPDWRIILLLDIAYIDFAGPEARDFMPLLAGLPENVLVLYAFSASKGYTMYGLRNGALLCAAPTEEIADEFANSCSFSNRGTWSNGTRGAMQTLADIWSDDEKLQPFLAEQKENAEMLRARADAFLKASEEAGLKIAKYVDGFFISIPCDNPQAAADKLMEDDIFVVALKKGLRFAPCAVSEAACAKAPAKIKQAVDATNN